MTHNAQGCVELRKRAMAFADLVFMVLLCAAAIQAAMLPGTAAVSGSVEGPEPFKAAQVYFRNNDKRMLYMVYTVGGKYQAWQLFPGEYDVSVKAKGLSSEVTKLSLKAGQTATVDLKMRESSANDKKKDIAFLKFDEIYPPGPGLDVAKRTCIYCHGQNFLPGKHWDAKQWEGALDFMTGKSRQGAMIQPDEMTDANRKDLLAYLEKNFGPGSANRAVKVDVDMPVDESKLAKAEYIEYYFQTDPPGQGVNDPAYSGVKSPFGKRRVGQEPQLDGNGNLWITDRGFPNRVVKLDPRTGDMKDVLTPQPLAGVHDLEIDRKNQLLWLPENEGVPEGNLKMRAYNLKTAKWEQEYLMDPNYGIPKGTLKHAQSLVFDSKGNIFYVFILGGAIGKWDRETKKMTTYPIPTPNSFPYGIVRDKHDNIWFAEFHGSKLAKLDTKTGKITEYESPTHPVLIRRLNVDSDGETIWSGGFSAGTLMRLDPSTGKIKEWKIPQQVSEPYDFAPENGKVWFSDAGQDGALIQFDPKTEKFTYYPSPQRADMPKIRVTKEGGIWYSPRSSLTNPGAGVLYPDITKVTTLGAYY